MTRDEIIRLAVECQLVTTGNRDGIYMDALERFANAVVQAELDALRSEDDECPVCGEVGLLTSCGAEYCGLVSAAPTPPSVPDLPPEVVELVRYRNVVSYNDSYFGEPEGLVKRALAALDRTAAPKPGERNENL